MHMKMNMKTHMTTTRTMKIRMETNKDMKNRVQTTRLAAKEAINQDTTEWGGDVVMQMMTALHLEVVIMSDTTTLFPIPDIRGHLA